MEKVEKVAMEEAAPSASASEAVVDVDVIERRPLIMDRDDVDLEAGPGEEQPQCRICLESDGNSCPYPCLDGCIACDLN